MAGRTGPRTTAGKRRSSMNRLTHGLRVKGVLPCRKKECFYFSRCPVLSQAPDAWPEIQYGDPCPWEEFLLVMHRETSFAPDGFDKRKPKEVELVDRLAYTFIRSCRSEMALAIILEGHPDPLRGAMHKYITTDVFSSDEERKIAYYARRIETQRRKAIRDAAPYIRGIIEIHKYQERLNRAAKARREANE